VIHSISFREVMLEDAELILQWRTKGRITRFMQTDIAHDLDAQKQWISRCYDKENYYHWILQFDDEPAGLINIADYRRSKNVTSWGVYIGSDDWVGYGGFVPPYFHRWAFQSLGVNEIKVECFYNNLSVIRLALLHGYNFNPSEDRVLRKHGSEVLLVATSLTRNNWELHRRGNSSAAFPVSRWNCAPEHLRASTLRDEAVDVELPAK